MRSQKFAIVRQNLERHLGCYQCFAAPTGIVQQLATNAEQFTGPGKTDEHCFRQGECRLGLTEQPQHAESRCRAVARILCDQHLCDFGEDATARRRIERLISASESGLRFVGCLEAARGHGQMKACRTQFASFQFNRTE